MSVRSPQHPDARTRENEISQPNRLRRKIAVLRLIDADREQRLIDHQDRQEADEKAGDEFAESHLYGDRYADQHKAQAAKPICPTTPWLRMQPVQTLLPDFNILFTRLPGHSRKRIEVAGQHSKGGLRDVALPRLLERLFLLYNRRWDFFQRVIRRTAVLRRRPGQVLHRRNELLRFRINPFRWAIDVQIMETQYELIFPGDEMQLGILGRRNPWRLAIGFLYHERGRDKLPSLHGADHNRCLAEIIRVLCRKLAINDLFHRRQDHSLLAHHAPADGDIVNDHRREADQRSQHKRWPDQHHRRD